MQYSALTVAALAGIAQAIDVHVVNVGWNPVNNVTGVKYWPEKVTAQPGDMVQFQFWAGAHTITQSNFDNVCTPINEVNSSIAGVDSGSMPVEASAEMFEIPTYTVMINDTAPLWFYCATGPHCQNGMAMVINENTGANATRSLENYKALAAGEEVESGSGSDSGSGSGSGNAGGDDDSTTPGGSTGGDDTTTTPGGDAGGEGEIDLDNGAPILGPDGTPISGAGAAEETNVPAAASSYAAPSTLLLAIGAAFMLL